MPYITKERREWLDGEGWGNRGFPENAGDLNYLFTDIIAKYIHPVDTNYQRLNDVIGALESAKLEFYRRVVVPYEYSKIVKNGDIAIYRESS